uniref:Uncharacterized protein n=1 Tax=Rhizophora mucronata TaxID=61149 RepID=A0A2P2P9H9_RHIMU
MIWMDCFFPVIDRSVSILRLERELIQVSFRDF